MSKVRASSQISVYNYPEHLNPFYEDEQHKRLRFWKIKTSKKSDGSLRRGSFNLGSLRDLLPFRSFRSKKNSSTLGINQTSESPPPLRRDMASYNKEDENLYATYDPHFRHTVDGQFHRNAGYRSSLQNMNGSPSADFLTFNRNNRYRNTMQNGTSTQSIKNGRYVYSGSMTPQPKTRYLTDITPRMTPGSSMNSISTNPFEDDEDVIEEQMEVTTAGSLKTPKIVKPARKKRKAPAPPGQQQMLGAVPSEKENVERTTNGDGLEELSRMTAEFESFVKNTQNEPQILLNGEKMNESISEEIVEKQNAKVSAEIVQTQSKQNEVEKLETKRIVEKPDIIQSIEIENASRAENKICVEVSRGEKEEVKLDVQETIITSQEITEIQEIKILNKVNENIKIQEVKFSPQNESKIQETCYDENSNELSKDEIKIQEIEPVKLQIRENEENIQVVEVKETKIKPEEQIQFAKFSRFKAERQHDQTDVPQLVITETKILKIDEPKESTPPTEIITAEVHQLLTEIRSFPDVRHLTPTPTPSREVTPDYIPMTVREKFHVLRIDEDEIESNNFKEELEVKNEVEPPKIEPRSVRDRTPIPLARTEVEDRLQSQGFRKVVTKTEFLNFDNPESVELRQKDSTDELLITEGDEPTSTSQRRRSVKEIIESINRQQQKLKINQPSTPQFERKFYYGEEQKFSYHEKPAVPSKENVMLKLMRHEEQERKINELLDDLQGYTKENSSIPKPTQKFPLSQRHSNNNSNSFLNHSADTINPINPKPKPRRAV